MFIRGICISLLVWGALMLNGCQGNSAIVIDKCAVVPSGSNHYVISSQEMRRVGMLAARDIMMSESFNRYLSMKRKEFSDASWCPLLKIGIIDNDTTDPDLMTQQITTVIADALSATGRVKILNNKADRERRILDREETPRPDLLLSGEIAESVDRSKKGKVVEHTFRLQISDLKTGEDIWRYSRLTGIIMKRTVLGK